MLRRRLFQLLLHQLKLLLRSKWVLLLLKLLLLWRLFQLRLRLRNNLIQKKKQQKI
jgi:hypothetical protein